MARPKSPDKRKAILEAAVSEIAESGLSAPTAKIARRADVGTGTLFTYFSSKEQLLNELYLELKLDLYQQVNAGFPHTASLEKRAQHLWRSLLAWAMHFPAKRKVSLQLNVSDVVTPETRAKTLEARRTVESTLRDLEKSDALRGLPGFAGAVISAMQDATAELIVREPARREEIIDRGFEIFWRAVR